MRGYVQNQGKQAYFVCQRQIPPGGKVELDDVYKSVGKKSGLDDGPEFLEWIKTNVFRRGSWGYFEEEGKPFSSPKTTKKTKAPVVEKEDPDVEEAMEKRRSSKKGKDAKGGGRSLRRDADKAMGVKVTPAAIIEAPYEQARGLIEKTKDRVILKKALNLTKHFSGKEQHMRHIIKRLEQVY